MSDKATGGLIHHGGPDSIRAKLSAGEYVINAATVRRLGRDYIERLNGTEEQDVD